MKFPKNIEISGPFFEYSAPWGKALEGLNRDKWYVSKSLPECIQKTEIQKILKSTSLGTITRFHSKPKRFVINQLYPTKDFTSLNKAVQFLIENEGKLVFCS